VQSILFVRWRVAPAASAAVIRHCPRCERNRPFESSGRFRVNAQKKRLDAWLIYRCSHCERTWNHPVFERKRVQEVDTLLLERLHANCAVLAAELACRGQVAEPAALRVEKKRIEGDRDAVMLTIQLHCTSALRCRVDRLLAAELGLSRARVACWEAEGLLVARPSQRFVQDGQEVEVALAALARTEREAVIKLAIGA
jgi:hypothetical protein